jgi:glycosyltransferase involved in cell wall biosynthesis
MKKQNTLVSILIINYNNEKFVSRAINSCLTQNYKNIEILIHDDKSMDDSFTQINKFKKNKKVKILTNKSKKKNISSFDAMNGYLNLFKKSKGKIICLLDSDDFFHKSKIQSIVNYFEKNQNIEFVQNLPIIKYKKNSFYKMNKNNFFSFWPYLAPESCISFRKNFMNNFIRKNRFVFQKYDLVWLGFRLGVYAYFIEKKFGCMEKNLTYYESLGESKKYSFMNHNWLFRRKQSFEYLKKVSKKNINKNLDYFLTKFFCSLLKIVN